MPSTSKAQARYVQHAAAKGEKWAQEWATTDSAERYAVLPERKGKRPKPKASFAQKIKVR